MSDAEQLGLLFQAPPRKVYPVRELVAAVRTQLERGFTDVYVEGEISNWRPAESGHLYFTLKDGSSQLRVVMWRTQARLLRFRPENGLQVIARGRVTVYDERGDMQFQAEHLEPKGAGALQVAFEQLKAKLAAEGLFDPARRKPIPALPRRIGLVTSTRGAAVQDILNILRRRHESVNVLIYPAQVQGEAAANEVSTGVRYFNRQGGVDVIIVARGGGSFEDLFAFNDEGLARTIAASEIPVISAVGHETDFTICDFVADLRAPTPSAAAELVIRSRQSVEDQAVALLQRLERAVRYRLLMGRQALTELAQHGAFGGIMGAIRQRQQRLDDLTYRMERGERRLLEQMRRRWETVAAAVRHYDLGSILAGMRIGLGAGVAALAGAMRNVLLLHKTRAERLRTALESLSPLAVLERGYALVVDASGQLLKDAGGTEVGQEISARLARGEIVARVTKQWE